MTPNNLDGAWFRQYYARHNNLDYVKWRGVPIIKSPLDLWVYQELIWELKPALIIETGTYYGSSATYFSDMGAGKVVTIDIEPRVMERDARVEYIVGSSLDPDILNQTAHLAADRAPVMVVLDSDHHHDHVQAEMEAYGPFVTPGSYMVVEDSCIGGHPLDIGDPDTGPWLSLQRFLPGHPEFEVDTSREKFGVTNNPGGWLKKKPL